MEEYMKKKIVVIDDDEMVLSVLKKFLSTFNMKVYTATCVTEGIKLVMDYYPDLIITDIDLGHLNGLDFYEVMRKHDMHEKCLFITGYDPDDLVSHYHPNFDLSQKTINKPFNYVELANKMFSQLNVKQSVH